MADTKISALTAATAALAADEIPVNEAGTTKKVTIQQIRALLGLGPFNASVADQAINATTAYVTNSNLAMPATKAQIKTVLRWHLTITKSAAGTTAGCAVLFKMGTNGSNADATILTFTFGTPTGAADTAEIDVEVTIRGPLSASCIASGIARMTHNLQITGFSTLPCEAKAVTSAGFDITVANLIAGLSITTTTASVWTVTQCIGEAIGV